jgi:hypothetical protein
MGEWIDLDGGGSGTSPADVIRITSLEDHYEIYQYFGSIASGTTGSVTLPTGYDIDLDRFGNGIDAIITTLGTDSRPLDQVVYTGAGVLVTTTLSGAGAYVLSGTPASYPVGITYYLKGKTKYKDNLVYNNILEADMLISSSYSGTSTTNVVNEYALSTGLATKQNTLTNPVTGNGSGTDNQLVTMTGANAIQNEANALYDGTNFNLGNATTGNNLNLYGTQGAEMMPALTGNSGDANGWTLSSTTGYVQPFNNSVDKTGNGTGTLTPTNASTAPTVGSNYIITIVVATMSGTSAAITVTFGGNFLTTITASGTYTYKIIATSTAKLIITGTPTATRYSITTISQKVYSQGNVLTDGTMQIGNAVGIGITPDPTTYALKVNGDAYLKGSMLLSGNLGTASSSSIIYNYITASGTALTTGISSMATSLALVGTPVRNPGALVFRSTAWNTTPTAASKNNEMAIGLMGISGTTTSSRMDFIDYVADAVSTQNIRASLTSGGNFGVGITAPTNLTHIGGGANAAYFQATNTATGNAATDGTLFGIDSSGNGIINQQEALPLIFYTTGTERLRLLPSGGRSSRTGLYNYLDTSATADTLLDVRFSNQSGYLTVEQCTVANATKATGTWTSQAKIGYLLNNIHATFKSPASAGVFHAMGFYEAPAAHAVLNQGATTQTMGSANNAYQAHAFIVASTAGTASGGAGAVTLVISGTSVSSSGTRTASDTEVIVPDITALSTNTYIESTKMWVGTVTYTLTVGATGHTAYALTFNYGLTSAMHFGEKNVTIRQFEATGRAGQTDTGFNIQLLKHSKTGWTYSAAAFVAGGTVLLNMNTDFSTEKTITSGKRFHYHRKGLITAINGGATATLTDPNEGVVVRITTSQNSSVDTMDMRIFYD